MAVTTELDSFRGERRRSLRKILIAATSAAYRDDHGLDLGLLVRAAPMAHLPSAAALHRVAGSVFQALESVPGVPTEVANALNLRRRHAALRHLIMSRALVRIADALDTADISWLVMKGPALASLLYEHPGDRSYNDLDLLIDRSHLPHAVELLEGLGFSHSTHDWALAQKMGAGEFVMSDAAVSLDVHWHVLYSDLDRRPYAIEPRDLLARARRMDISGHQVPVLDPVDTLLTLTFHASRSDGHRLVWMKDIERAIANDQPDLDELVRRAHTFACAPPVGLALSRAHSLVGAEVPNEITRALVPTSIRSVDHLARFVSNPIQFHERPTPTRWVTRSVKSSPASSIRHLPHRALRATRARWMPEALNETDDPAEKSEFFEWVATWPGPL